jgi:hypothetical protein
VSASELFLVVRGVIPPRQKYDGMAGPKDQESLFAGHPTFSGGEEQHLGPILRRGLQLATEVDIGAAFVQRPAVRTCSRICATHSTAVRWSAC